MSEDRITEKVYCYDHPSAYGHNNDALAMAMLANQKNNADPMAMAAMMNGGMGMNNWMNNSRLEVRAFSGTSK